MNKIFWSKNNIDYDINNDNNNNNNYKLLKIYIFYRALKVIQ